MAAHASLPNRPGRFAWVRTHSELMRTLLRRELRARYMSSLLGVLWSYLQPLMMMLVYTLVFGVFFQASVKHFPQFLLTGIAVWNLFQAGVVLGATSIVSNAHLVKKIYFPRAVLPTAYVLAQGVTSLVMLIVLVPLNIIVTPAVARTALLAVPMLAGLLLLTLGMAWALAAWNVFYRDVEHFLTVVMLPWFFLTPVLYELNQKAVLARHPWLLHLFRYGNPVAPYVEGIRAALFNGTVIKPAELIYMAVVGPAVAVAGMTLLHHYEDRFAVEL